MLEFKKIKGLFKRNVTVFSFPHANKEQLDQLLTDLGKFGKTTDDVMFTSTDLRDGSIVKLKIKGNPQ